MKEEGAGGEGGGGGAEGEIGGGEEPLPPTTSPTGSPHARSGRGELAASARQPRRPREPASSAGRLPREGGGRERDAKEKGEGEITREIEKDTSK